ncbi:MAG: hypothetical protein GXY79_09875, partial [Chloroflexi bacterium]|nr:hypothetical protein [Chloroflexota bacterium]
VGTGNLWAHMLGMPVWSPVYRSALVDAARILVQGEKRRIDVGRAGEHHFIMWCGIGFDAQIVQDVEPHREVRRSLGNLTYGVAGLAEAFFMRGARATVVVDGRATRYRALMIVISNAQLYGPSLRLAPEAKLDDGLFDIFIFRGNTVVDIFWHLGRLIMGNHAGSPEVEVLQGRDIYVVTEDTLPVQVDGDPIAATPLSVQVLPRSLSIVVPRWAPNSLFSAPGRPAPSEITAVARLKREWRRVRPRLGSGGRSRRGRL